MTLPKLPPLFDGVKARDIEDLARRVFQWVSPVHTLLKAIRLDPRWTDDRTAKGLRTREGSVDVTLSSSPSEGQVLIAQEPDRAEWGKIELAPSDEEVAEFTYAGSTVYKQRFTGIMPTTVDTLISGGVDYAVAVFGWVTDGSGNKVTPGLVASSQVWIAVGGGNLVLSNGGTGFDGNAYDLSVWYVKS